jgi:hypothetical protein
MYDVDGPDFRKYFSEAVVRLAVAFVARCLPFLGIGI